MKRKTGIWLDSAQAIIVDIFDDYEDVQIIKSSIDNKIHHNNEGIRGDKQGGQWINHEKTFDEKKKNQMNEYLTGIIKEIENWKVEELYLFGPSGTKTQLHKMLQDRKDMKEMKIVEATADSMTTNQVVHEVKAYFGK